MFACWVILHAFVDPPDFFLQSSCFKLIISGTLSECQTLWTQNQTKRTLDMIWVRTVCKGYHEQMTKVAANKERVIAFSGCPPVREKSGKFGFSSRSGKSQGIL